MVHDLNLTAHASEVCLAERYRILGQKPTTIWFTGLSGAGKSTLAYMLEKELVSRGRITFVLDGDNVRHGLNSDLSFTPSDRRENIRRIAEMAKLMNEAGLITVTAFISPFQMDRDMARKIIGEDRFIEVYVSTPIEVCKARDTKGLYEKANAGNLPEFTGVSSPYETPVHPNISLNTSAMNKDACMQELLRLVLPQIALGAGGDGVDISVI